jgi:DNA-binding XRE family transcriptional regulator
VTQTELARLAGVGKTAVFDIEKDKPGVRLSTLLRVLSVLNIEIELRDPFGKVATLSHPDRSAKKDSDDEKR